MIRFLNDLAIGLVLAGALSVSASAKQLRISRVDKMAEIPQPLVIIDFKKMALDFDKYVYDFDAKEQFWPLIWIDDSRKNFDQPVIGLYTALGDSRQGLSNNKGMFHEAVATMGAVLGASLVGIDKSKQQYDYVAMLKNYFNKDTGWNIFQNNTNPEVALQGGGYGRDWWYDIFPNVLFYAIYDKYPDQPGFADLAKQVAEKFYAADVILKGNYDHTFFDYAAMKPMTNQICHQPDAAAGHAYVLYSAYQRFGDSRFLDGAASAMTALQSNATNPTYEVLMPFGAYVAARLNAEHGRKFDVAKFIEWSFEPTPGCRKGWGTIVDRWNGIDVSGIVGNAEDHGGYGFLMNTYDMAWPLVPLVRYDQSYANAIGKWMLNAANAARLFYPDHISADHQTLPHMAPLTKGVIAYEGLVKTSTHDQFSHIQAPVAQGDGPKWTATNPDASQFSVYGSGHVGIFGSIIETTGVPGLLKLDLLATDFHRQKAYPTSLFYNPYLTEKRVRVPVTSTVDFYDTVTGKFLARGVRKLAEIAIPPRGSRVVVLVPAKAVLRRDGEKLLANEVVIDFHARLVP